MGGCINSNSMKEEDCCIHTLKCNYKQIEALTLSIDDKLLISTNGKDV